MCSYRGFDLALLMSWLTEHFSLMICLVIDVSPLVLGFCPRGWVSDPVLLMSWLSLRFSFWSASLDWQHWVLFCPGEVHTGLGL